mgnify:CR=1 FL=1
MNVAGFIARTKYYSVWCIACVPFSLSSRATPSADSRPSPPPRSESAFIISGLGYNPQTKHYDASRNVRIRSIEFAPNFKVRLLSPSSSSSRS